MRVGYALVVFLICVSCFICGRFVYGEPTTVSMDSTVFGEYEIKAGFIYRFISFVSWPEESVGDVITIGILGPNPFGDAFAAIEGSIVGDRRVEIAYFDRDTDYEVLKRCQILFISDLPDGRLRALFDALSDSPVLTIGESRGFIDRGGMIGFVRQDRRRIGIEINVTAAQTAGLTIRSMLKRIAGRIIRESQTSPSSRYVNG